MLAGVVWLVRVLAVALFRSAQGAGGIADRLAVSGAHRGRTATVLTNGSSMPMSVMHLHGRLLDTLVLHSALLQMNLVSYLQIAYYRLAMAAVDC